MNKFLVTIYIPTIEKNYDILIPNSKRIADVITLCVEVINSLNDNQFQNNQSIKLINRLTGKEYLYNEVVSNTDIKNATELIMI